VQEVWFWWYGEIFEYDEVYRERLLAGLRKAGVPEGAGTDIKYADFKRLIQHSAGEYDGEGATKIDAARAKALHARDVVFVDVRSPLEFNVAKPFTTSWRVAVRARLRWNASTSVKQLSTAHWQPLGDRLRQIIPDFLSDILLNCEVLQLHELVALADIDGQRCTVSTAGEVERLPLFAVESHDLAWVKIETEAGR
jgi:hypothetical protein